MIDFKTIDVDGNQNSIKYSHAYAPFDFGQKNCYKCGSVAKVRAHKHDILGETYDVCCSNPACGVSSSRYYAYRHNAVEAWNRKPTVGDIFYDTCLSKLFDKLLKEEES